MGRPFADLLTDGQYSAAVMKFEAVLVASFGQRPVRHMTQQHIKDRYALCEKIFRLLRGDLKWGLERVWGHMLGYLLKELDGSDWKPDARTVWAPGDG